MTQNNQETDLFVDYLETLTENRAALAALRRGLGRPPGSVPETFPYIIRHLPKQSKPWLENACYLSASLFAMHPSSEKTGNMGSHFARTLEVNSENEAVNRRFTALLACHSDDLPFYLRQAISFLKSKEVPVNWHQLIRDINHWDHPDRFVQRNWANAFWGYKPEE